MQAPAPSTALKVVLRSPFPCPTPGHCASCLSCRCNTPSTPLWHSNLLLCNYNTTVRCPQADSPSTVAHILASLRKPCPCPGRPGKEVRQGGEYSCDIACPQLTASTLGTEPVVGKGGHQAARTAHAWNTELACTLAVAPPQPDDPETRTWLPHVSFMLFRRLQGTVCRTLI